MTEHNQPLQLAYSILSGDDDQDRACSTIPDDACHHLPRNYVLNVLNGTCTKLAEQIAGPNLVLPWLLTAVGAPVFLTGLLMPLKQTGSLLPQLAVSGTIRGAAQRKWFWVGAGAFQALMLVAMAAAVVLLASPLYVGLAIVFALALFSVASGVGSVAFQDVVGKTIDKGLRGTMLSYRAAFGGALAVAFGLAIKLALGQSANPTVYVGLVLIGACLWALAAALFAAIREQPGATGGGRNAIAEARTGTALLRRYPGYRRYLLARAALVSIEIAAPFYVIAAHHQSQGAASLLGLLVLAVALARVLSSPFWGRFSDTSARRVMALAGLVGVLPGALALALIAMPVGPYSAYGFGLVFFILGFAEAGVRLGRKTYLVDAAPEKERPTLVAFANSAIGVITLLGGVLGAVAQWGGLTALLAVLVAAAATGSGLSLAMPEAEDFA